MIAPSQEPAASQRPRLFVHVGVAKTGTTSLQSFLIRRRDDLAAAGLFVPLTGSYAAFGGGHHLLPWVVNGRYPERRPAIGREAMLDRLVEEIAGCGAERAVVSSEEFPSLTDEEIAVLAERLAPFDPVAVIVMRRSGDVIETGYRTHIVAGLESTFDEFAAIHTIDYLQLARRWSRLSPCGELRIGSYDDPAVRADIVGTVLGWIAPELAIERPDGEPRLNAGLPAPIIELARTLRREGAPLAVMQRWLARCTTMPISRSGIDEPTFLTAAHDAALDAAYVRQIDAIENDPALAPHVRGRLPRPTPRKLRSMNGLAGAILQVPELLSEPGPPPQPPIPRRLMPHLGPDLPHRVPGHFDPPTPGAPGVPPRAAEQLDLAGWAIYPGRLAAGPVAVLQPVDGTAGSDMVVRLRRTESRPDVAAAHPHLPAAATMQSGFRVAVDAGGMARGRWRLRLGFPRPDGIVYADHRIMIELVSR